MSEENVFYVYEHWRPDTGVCFYVGKGKARRAWSMRDRNNHHMSVISKLTSMGLSVDVRIVLHDVSEKTAFMVEIDRIAMYPKGQLVNKTPGGTGISGWKLSKEQKTHLSKIAKGRKLSEEHKAKVGAFFRGRKLKPEHVAKMRDRMKGRRPADSTLAAARASRLGKKMSPETLAKMSASRLGKKLSSEHRAAISAGQKGRPISDEQKIKMRLAWKTRPPMTEETRRKLSESAKLDWAKRKAI